MRGAMMSTKIEGVCILGLSLRDIYIGPVDLREALLVLRLRVAHGRRPIRQIWSAPCDNEGAMHDVRPGRSTKPVSRATDSTSTQASHPP